MLRAWDLHDNLDSRRRDPVPALREPRAGRGAGGGHARPLHDPVRRQRPGPHAARPEHRQPGRRAVVRRRGQRPARRGHPARRAAARLAVRAPRLRADPDPRRARRRRACSTRSTSSWTGSGANAGYPNVPHGSSFVMAAQFTDDPDCPVDTRTILTYSQSTNPNSPYFADQTRMFSQQGVGRRGLLRGRDRGRPEPRRDRTISEGGPATRGRRAPRRCACRSCPPTSSARRRTAPTGRRSRSRRARRRRRRPT